MTTATPAPRPRKRRPHPARSTRRAVGAASVGATLVLAGGMALAARHTASTATAASGTTQNTIASSNFGESESDDGATSANSSVFGSINTPAQPGAVSQQPITASNAS